MGVGCKGWDKRRAAICFTCLRKKKKICVHSKGKIQQRKRDRVSMRWLVRFADGPGQAGGRDLTPGPLPCAPGTPTLGRHLKKKISGLEGQTQEPGQWYIAGEDSACSAAISLWAPFQVHPPSPSHFFCGPPGEAAEDGSIAWVCAIHLSDPTRGSWLAVGTYGGRGCRRQLTVLCHNPRLHGGGLPAWARHRAG